MYTNVSSSFLSKIAQPSRHFEARFYDGSTLLDLEILHIDVTTGTCGGSNLAVGCAFAGYLTVSARYTDIQLEGKELKLELGLLLDDSTYEYIPFGYWTVQKPTVQKDIMSFTAVDRMASKFNEDYSSSLTYPATIASVLSELSTATGVTINCNLQTSLQMPVAIEDMSQRGALAVIANCLLACAWVDRNGMVNITAYGNSSTQATVDYDYVKEQPNMDEKETLISGVKVYTVDGQTDTWIETGTDHMITTSNVYTTQTMLNATADNVVGLEYNGGSVKFMGNPLLDPSDTITFNDGEADQYVPCMEITQAFDGGLLTTVTAPGSFEVTESTIQTGPIAQEMERRARATAEAQATADEALTTAEDAATAAEDAMVLATGKSKIFYSATAPTSGMSSGDMWMKLDGSNALYQYSGSSWTLRQFGQGSIVAGSITGNEIYGNTVSALRSNLGTIVAGILQSYDYEYGTGPYFCQEGLIVNLNSKIIMTPKFSVIGGVLRATDGIFSGQITSESGKIGNWTISNYQIAQATDIDTSDTDLQTQYMAFMRSKDGGGTTPATGETYAFGAFQRSYEDGTYGNWSSNFYVKYDGYLFSRIGKIGPWNIAETSIYKGGGYQSSTAGSAYFGDSGFSITDKFYITNTGEAHVLGAGLYISDDVSDYGRIQFSQGAIASDVIGFMISTARDLYIGAGLGYDGYGNISIDGFGKIYLLGCAGVRIRAIKNNNYTNIELEGNIVVKNNNLSLMKESYERGVAPSSPIYSAYAFTDVNGDTIGFLRSVVATNGNHSLQLVLSTPTAAGGDTAALSLTKNASEVVTCRIAGATTVEGDITAEVSTASACAVHAKNSLVEARLIAAASGNVGVYNATNSKWLIYMNTDSDPKPIIPQLATVTTTSAGNVFANSSGALYRNTSSSKRYKHDIKKLKDWKKILDIPVVSFVYNDGYVSEEDQRYHKAVPGFIAEEVEKAYPIAAEKSDGKVEDWNVRFVIPPMLAVEQDHEKRIKELEEEIRILKGGTA